jgi:hypothetical protein
MPGTTHLPDCEEPVAQELAADIAQTAGERAHGSHQRKVKKDLGSNDEEENQLPRAGHAAPGSPRHYSHGDTIAA